MDASAQVPEEEGVGTQDEPIMDQDDVPDEAKLNGIVVQTISDLGAQHPLADIEAVVRSRSVESGLNYSSGEVTAAVREALRKPAVENDFETEADR